VEQDPILKVKLSRSRQHHLLEVAAFSGQIFRRIAVADAYHILSNKRAAVKLGGARKEPPRPPV